MSEKENEGVNFYSILFHLNNKFINYSDLIPLVTEQ